MVSDAGSDSYQSLEPQLGQKASEPSSTVSNMTQYFGVPRVT